jgi:hypothetical protein
MQGAESTVVVTGVATAGAQFTAIKHVTAAS